MVYHCYKYTCDLKSCGMDLVFGFVVDYFFYSFWWLMQSMQMLPQSLHFHWSPASWACVILLVPSFVLLLLDTVFPVGKEVRPQEQRPHQAVLSPAVASHVLGFRLQDLRFTFNISLYPFLWPPLLLWPSFSSPWRRSFGILMFSIRTVCPAHLTGTWIIMYYIPWILQHLSTSVSGTLSIQSIPAIFLRHLRWKWSSSLM